MVSCLWVLSNSYLQTYQNLAHTSFKMYLLIANDFQHNPSSLLSKAWSYKIFKLEILWEMKMKSGPKYYSNWGVILSLEYYFIFFKGG